MIFHILVRSGLETKELEIEAHSTMTNPHGHVVFLNENKQLVAMVKDWILVRAIYEEEEKPIDFNNAADKPMIGCTAGGDEV